MIEKIRTYFNEGAIYYGIEACEQEGNLIFHLLELQRKKGTFFITNTQSLSALEEISTHIKKNTPLFLAINTSHVLTKISTQSGTPNEALVHQTFPNLDFENFYYEVAPMGGKTMVSIAKKTQVQKILDQFKAQKLSLIDFSLGISAVKTLNSYLANNTLYLSNTKIVIQEGTIENTLSFSDQEQHSSFSNDINGLQVPQNGVLGFANILKHLSKDQRNFINFQDEVSTQEREFKDKRHFEILLKASLAAILGLLLINFLFFNHYYGKVETLKTSSEVNSTNKARLNELKTIVEQKEERVNTILATSNSKVSFYLDALAQSIPHTILLNVIQYQPLKKPPRPSKPIEYDENTITVSGSTTDGAVFSSWLETLEALDWIHSAETTDYDYGTNNSSNFSIKIVMNDQ
ncbi:hypothetical protein [Spongiimicrobium salis]|uniref:hypothetical protein n=1 Tax=Spongiimicrobium salis TaxID=1667022 RepID=UPI00374CD308